MSFSLASILQTAVEKTQSVYLSAIQRQLVFFSPPDDSHVVKSLQRIDALQTSPLRVLVNSRLTARRPSSIQHDRYLPSPNEHKRVPTTFIFPLPCQEPTTEVAREWRDEDDYQVGEAAIFTMDYYSFGEKGPMLHGIDDVGCYLIESTVGPMDFISHFRRLYLHLHRKSLLEPNAPKCYQTFCQGLWSSMDLQRNEHARLITLRFCDGTRHPLKTLVLPQMILNFMAIDRDKQEFPNEIWYIIQSLILASIGVSADDTGPYIFWIRSQKQMLQNVIIQLNLGASTTIPSNINEIIEAMRHCQYIDLISSEQHDALQAFWSSNTTDEMELPNALRPLSSETASVSIADSYMRTVDRSRVEPSKLASGEEISEIRAYTSLIHTLHLAQSMLVDTHTKYVQEGHPGLQLRCSDDGGEDTNGDETTACGAVEDSKAPTSFVGAICIALPDHVVHPYCLRNVHQFDQDDREVMIRSLYDQLGREWNYTKAGEGPWADDRNEYVYSISSSVHEFA